MAERTELRRRVVVSDAMRLMGVLIEVAMNVFKPRDKAVALIEALGVDGAHAQVLEEVQSAHRQADNYALSLWREVRREIEGVLSQKGTRIEI